MNNSQPDSMIRLRAKYLGEKGGCWNMLVFVGKDGTKQVLIPKQHEYSGVDFSQTPFGEQVDIKLSYAFVNRHNLMG